MTVRLFSGKVISYDETEHWYLVRYEDDDEEELFEADLAKLVVTDATRQVQRAPPEQTIADPLCLFQLHGLDPAKAPYQIRGFAARDQRKVAEFFLFMNERQRMWLRRNRGDAAPWSACPALQQYSWCNNYRELDRGTAFFRAHVLELKDDNPGVTRREFLRRVLFDSYLYRLCNRIETFLETGFPEESKLGPFFGKLEEIKAAQRSVFTGAHQTTNIENYEDNVKESTKKTEGHSLLDCVCDEIIAAGNKKSLILEELQKLKGVGSFFAWQVSERIFINSEPTGSVCHIGVVSLVQNVVFPHTALPLLLLFRVFPASSRFFVTCKKHALWIQKATTIAFWGQARKRGWT